MNKTEIILTMTTSPDWQIILPMPPSVNACTANAKKGRVKTEALKRWRIAASCYFWQSIHKWGVPKEVLKPPYMIVYEMQRPDNRKRDCANFEKAISDLLVTCDVLVDDSKIDCNMQFWSDKKGKEVTVSIWGLG